MQSPGSIDPAIGYISVAKSSRFFSVAAVQLQRVNC